MDKKVSNILEGEASESDEEISDYPGFIQNTKDNIKSQSDGPSSSVVVSGEASESDEDDEGKSGEIRPFPTLQQQNSQEQEKQQQSANTKENSTLTFTEQERPEFESPFHRKIYENNFSLRLGIVRTHLERYDHVTNRIRALLQHESKTQTYIQETLKHYRKISESTKQLNDNLELLLKQPDLPTLKDPFPVVESKVHS